MVFYRNRFAFFPNFFLPTYKPRSNTEISQVSDQSDYFEVVRLGENAFLKLPRILMILDSFCKEKNSKYDGIVNFFLKMDFCVLHRPSKVDFWPFFR